MQQMYNRAMSVLICVLRFLVRLETMKPDKPDATVSLKEIKFIDVPAHAKRDYDMFFFFLTYTEGQYNTKVHSSIHIQTWITIFFSLVLTSSFYLHPWVTFINDETGEYLFYLVIFKGNISRSPVHHQAGETCLSGALGHYWSREPSDPDSLPYYWV